ncbi:hypothetical protein [Vibrio japonicus]|uniref:Uncharacterized protein n=1 Tax=Vibrio japonicus TaxID=1824638 RepID=A0ABY5LR52_9VIBR|nr:hypothetical protein [Vibrio japonicus]UUM33184.1 hypothetical protein NP165_13290 [Vibrio japonicus]
MSCVGFSGFTYANNFNYNFIEIRTATDPQLTGVEASHFLTQNTHVVARIDSQFDSDYAAAAGVGFNGPLSQFADIYGQVLAHRIEFPEQYERDSVTQVEMNIGFRLWLADQIEATGRIGRNDESSVFHAGVRFHSTDQLTLSGEMRNNGIYGPQLTMSVRFQY